MPKSREALRLGVLLLVLLALVAVIAVANFVGPESGNAPTKSAQPHMREPSVKITSAERERADANVSLRDGCAYTRDKPPQDAHGNVITTLMPRWVEVIDLHAANPLPGCIPRELLLPEIDSGKALAAYKAGAGFAETGVLRPPFPVFSVDAALVGFWATDGGQPSFIPIDTAAASGRVPEALIDNPPTPGDFSSVYR